MRRTTLFSRMPHDVDGCKAAFAIGLALAAGACAAQTVTVTNKLANGYVAAPWPSACPNGLDIRVPTGYRIERPHAIYNDKTKQYVLWAHYESSAPGSGYTLANAMVATSAGECGPYQYVKDFRPLGQQVRDDFLWKDDDGTAYFMAASNKNGGANDTLAIFRLTPDYLDVDSTAGTTWAFDGKYREAPIVAKSGGVYFLLTSAAAGWYPSQGMYATATSMLGPWSALQPLGNAATFGGQNADIKVIRGTQASANILVLDHLGGGTARDDGNLFLPVVLDPVAKTATLDWYSKYTVDLATGVLTLPSTNSLAGGKPATASSSLAANPPSNADDRSYQTEWVASSTTWPAWWQVDLGAAKPIREIQISWWMYKGSEAYYKYAIEYSTDGANYTRIDRSNNTLYGFTVDSMNISARYIRIRLLGAVLQNNPNNWYTPRLWHVRIL